MENLKAKVASGEGECKDLDQSGITRFIGINLGLLALLSYITSEDISLFDYQVRLVITFHVLCSDLS